MAINKTFSVRHGLDVANTIVLDSERNLSNINVANIHTVNANTIVVSGNATIDKTTKSNTFVSTSLNVIPPNLANTYGERLRLYDFQQAGRPNYAIGVEGNHIWMGVDDNGGTTGFKWYGNTTLAGLLRTNGTFEISNTVSAKIIKLSDTGTAVDASQGNILTNKVTGTEFAFLNGLYTTTVRANSAQSADYTFRLPSSGGVDGFVLSTDGTGNTAWSNTIYVLANTVYTQANAAYDAANTAANTVEVSQNTNLTFSAKKLNFVNTNTVSILVSNAASGYANIEFIAAPQTVVNDTYTATGNVTAAATANIANGLFAIATNAYDKANSAAITVREVYATNANIVNSFANINTLQFDTESGMAVVNNSSNTVTIKLNSTFKNWNINGNTGLVAFGLDTVNFIPLDGIEISANNSNTPKSFIISAPTIVNNSANAANTVTVSANSGSTLYARKLNFVNTSTIQVNVSDPGAGNANVSFDVLSNGVSIINSDVFVGTGACTAFTLTNSSETDKTFVYINGVSQKPEVDYQVSFKTLTFNVAPPSNTSIEIRTITDINLTNVSSIQSDQFIGNGSCTQFSLSSSSFTDAAFVFVDGVTQVPNVDYSVSGNTITFTSPPESNGVIEIRSLSTLQLFQYANNIVEGNTTLKIDNSKLEFYSNGFNVNTDSISRAYLLRGTTTNVTESEIFLSNGTRIPVAANSTVFYTADIVARRTDAANESSGFYIKGVVDNFSGTVADVGNLYEVVVAEDDVDWSVDARADDTNNSINIYVTGENAKTIRWTALVKTVEVAQ